MNRNVLFKYRQYLMKMHNNLPIAKENSIWETKPSIFPIFLFNSWIAITLIFRLVMCQLLSKLLQCTSEGLLLLLGERERTGYQEKLLAWNRNSLKLILVGQNVVSSLKTPHSSEQVRSEISFVTLPHFQFLVYNDMSSFSGYRALKFLSVKFLTREWWHYHSAIRLPKVIHQEAQSLFCLWHLPTAIKKEAPGYLKHTHHILVGND